MPPVKAISQAADKWVRRAGVAGPDYEAGVRNPRVPQAEAALAANDQWKAATASAAARDAFAIGVRKATTERWSRKSIEKGVPRYPQGVQVSQPDYQAAASPFFDVIQRTQLPPRAMTGDPRNYDRVRIMGQALRAAKTGGK